MLDFLGGLDTPTKGQILLNGMDISYFGDEKMSLIRRQKIRLVFQFYNLIPNLNVEENIMLLLLLDGKKMGSYQKQLREINQNSGQTIIMVTHSLEAAKSSSRVINVQDGVII